MTVKELRDHLIQYDDNCRVFEERGSECRELRVRDIRFSKMVMDNDEGVQITANPICPGFVVLGAWS